MIFANPTCFKRILPGGEGAEGKTAQDGPKTTQEAPKTAQEATKRAQEAPKTAQEAPKTAPRGGVTIDPRAGKLKDRSGTAQGPLKDRSFAGHGSWVGD